MLGEGAGVLVLESEEHARARGATIFAEYIGQGWSFDSTDDAAPDDVGQSLAMIRALKSAGIARDEISWLNAHGTGTPYNDRTETARSSSRSARRAYRVPISSIKSMTGHSAAAAGGLEAVASVLAIRDNIIPPTMNYEFPIRTATSTTSRTRPAGAGRYRPEQLLRHGRPERHPHPPPLALIDTSPRGFKFE